MNTNKKQFKEMAASRLARDKRRKLALQTLHLHVNAYRQLSGDLFARLGIMDEAVRKQMFAEAVEKALLKIEATGFAMPTDGIPSKIVRDRRTEQTC